MAGPGALAYGPTVPPVRVVFACLLACLAAPAAAGAHSPPPPSAGGPSVRTEMAYVGPDGATLRGTVWLQYGAPATVRFEYGPTAGYGWARGPAAAADGEPVEVQVSSLAPRTTYHWRLSATDQYGTRVTPDQTFTTPAARAPHLIEPPSVERRDLGTYGCYPGSWYGAERFAFAWSGAAGRPLNDVFQIDLSIPHDPWSVGRSEGLRCTVTAINASGRSLATSRPRENPPSRPGVTGPTGAPPAVSGPGSMPRILPSVPKAGDTLTCSLPGQPFVIRYVWLRDTAPVPGAHQVNYVTGAADAGHHLACQAVEVDSDLGQTLFPAPAVLVNGTRSLPGTGGADRHAVAYQLRAMLERAGEQTVSTLLEQDEASLPFLAPGDGRLTVRWTLHRHGRLVRLAAGSTHWRYGEQAANVVPLSRAAPRLLRAGGPARVSVTAGFAPDRAAPPFTVTRRRALQLAP